MTALQTLQRQTIEPLTFVNMFLIIWNVIDYLAGRHYSGRSNTSTGVSRRLFSYNSRGRNPIKSDLQSTVMRNKDTLLRFCELLSILKWLLGSFLYNFAKCFDIILKYFICSEIVLSHFFFLFQICIRCLHVLRVLFFLFTPSVFICRFSLLASKITSFLLGMI